MAGALARLPDPVHMPPPPGRVLSQLCRGGGCCAYLPEKLPLRASLHPHDNHPRRHCPRAREGQEGEVTFLKSTASNWQSQDSNSGSLALESMFSILRSFSRDIYRTTQNAIGTGLFFIAAELEEKQDKGQENKMKSCLNQSKKGGLASQMKPMEPRKRTRSA